MEFNIGDKVTILDTEETGTVTDKMYSEAKSRHIYVVKPDQQGGAFGDARRNRP